MYQNLRHSIFYSLNFKAKMSEVCRKKKNEEKVKIMHLNRSKSSKTRSYLTTFFESQFFLNLLCIYLYHKSTLTS